jgi:G3E family GTPase
MSPPIPFTVLGGYLGSGKTTLLNHVLRQAGGRRLGVIVNDFGALDIDASLIESRGNDVLSLANGCVCCSISAGFAEALTAMSRLRPAPGHVVIEASGVADPARVACFGDLPPYRLDGVVVVADAETIRRRAGDKYVGGTVLRQLRAADVIVLNKIDLIGAAEQAGLRTWLLAQVPRARLFAVRYGRVPLALLLGIHGDAAVPGEHDHEHGDDYASWSMVRDTPLPEAAFRAAVASWPAAVLRAKGLVWLTGDPARRHVFQLVGARWSLTPDADWGSERPRTEIVLIGLAGQLDGAALLAPLGLDQTAPTT